MSRIAHRYDESHVRSRATRRGSKPRTKTRPSHRDAESGQVRAVDRGRYVVGMHDDGRHIQTVRARELGRKSVVVGDIVDVVGDTSGAKGSLGRIVRVADRVGVLRRSADDVDAPERVLVANVEVMVIVTAAVDPVPRPGMIDRCLVAAHASGIVPVVCLTKTELQDPSELSARCRASGVQTVEVAVRADDRGVAHLEEVLAGRTSVLVGHSGVGKSTLVNRLVPQAQRATGAVNAVTGRGRHTSSSAVMLGLPGGGDVIDTPGVRSFGLAHLTDDEIVAGFEDLAESLALCPRRCSHVDEFCELVRVMESGSVHAASRAESLRGLLAGRHAQQEGGLGAQRR